MPEEEYDEAAVIAMLRSIRLVDPQTEAVPAENETPLDDPAAAGEVVDPGEDLMEGDEDPVDGDDDLVDGDDAAPVVGDGE